MIIQTIMKEQMPPVDLATIIKDTKIAQERLDQMRKLKAHQEAFNRIDSFSEELLKQISTIDKLKEYNHDSLVTIEDEGYDQLIDGLQSELSNAMKEHFESLITSMSNKEPSSNIPSIGGDRLAHLFQNESNELLRFSGINKFLDANNEKIYTAILSVTAVMMENVGFDKHADTLFLEYGKKIAHREYDK